MEPTPEQIIQQVEQLFKLKMYQEIISLLNDELLKLYNNAVLYAWRSRAQKGSSEVELMFFYAQKSLEIDPELALGYLARGNAWSGKKELDGAIADYTEAIRRNQSFETAYNNRGLAWYYKKEYDKAILDYNDAIRLGSNDMLIYYNRGNAWLEKKEYDKAIRDFDEAIRFNPEDPTAYLVRGNALFHKEEYDKATSDYTKCIQLLPDSAIAYYNRGLSLANSQKLDKAIVDYTDAIRLDPNDPDAYYNRGSAWEEKKEYSNAITDYQRQIELIKDPDEYFRKVAENKIRELKKKIENVWYDEIDILIEKIKQSLLFDSPCLTHYTSLSGAREMILKNSAFRLSEGAFLNDTSEGRELFKYLSFESTKRTADETMAELFVERPFIGSFVADNKHNDLTLWRMYGKEAQAEAKGCALTIYKTKFIDSLKKKVSPTDDKSETYLKIEDQFTFYNVAYLSRDKFIIPGKSNETEDQLNEIMGELKNKIEKLKENQKIIINKLINDIAYLFKSSEYQYENEVRLVVQGVGFTKSIEKDGNPPKVYIELVNIVPALNKITLGPKVERADEWAAAFNYHIKEQLGDLEERVEIIMSHLPFK